MSKNRTGGLTGNLEWGNKARKNEDAERNRNNRARREAVTEQADDYLGKDYDEAFYTEVLPS